MDFTLADLQVDSIQDIEILCSYLGFKALDLQNMSITHRFPRHESEL
jgi:hypothetical protein